MHEPAVQVDRSADLVSLAQRLGAEAAWGKGVASGDQRLLPAVVQCASSGAVLMLGYLSREALDETARRGEVVFYSRSREALWHKGETSGNRLRVEGMSLDCDGDTFLLLCQATGPVCHRGTPTCFDPLEGSPRPAAEGHRRLPRAAVLDEVFSSIQSRAKGDDPNSYAFRLLQSGRERLLKKVGEEATETVIAAMAGDRAAFAAEAADLLFHLLLAGAELGVSPGAILEVLEGRRGQIRRDGSDPAAASVSKALNPHKK